MGNGSVSVVAKGIMFVHRLVAVARFGNRSEVLLSRKEESSVDRNAGFFVIFRSGEKLGELGNFRENLLFL